MTATTGLVPAELQVFERGWLSANNVLFTGREQTALVDTGYVTHAAQTLQLVETALGPKPLDLLLNTHLHSDHCGGNAALQLRYPVLSTCIPPGEAAIVRRWDEDALSFRATGQHCPQFRFDGLLEPGKDVVLGDIAWQIHAAPGHDPHSVILFEPQSGTLISADALWEKGFGVVFPELAGEPSFDDVATTLDLIEYLKPQCVIPGHGGVFTDAASALTAARNRLHAFSKDPEKHARHAIKVLLKFKLLEVQILGIDEWKSWVSDTPYLETIRQRFFGTYSLVDLTHEILNELIRSGAAFADQLRIQNQPPG